MAFLHAFQEFISIADDSRLDHFAKKVVSFPCTLSDSGKNRKAVMFLCNIIDEFLDKDSLAHTGTSEKSDLSALEIRLEQVNDLDTSKKDLLGSRKILELRRFPMNRECTIFLKVTHAVDSLANYIHDPAADLRTDRHCDRRTGTYSLHAPSKPVSRIHCNSPDRILSNMLLHFYNKLSPIIFYDLQSFMDSRKLLLSIIP